MTVRIEMQEENSWTSLSDSEQQAVRRAMAYWVQHWDWECPTLFGLDREDIVNAIETWPHSIATTTSRAAIGSLRELLFGASTPARGELPRLIGMSYDRARDLLHAIVEGGSQRVQ